MRFSYDWALLSTTWKKHEEQEYSNLEDKMLRTLNLDLKNILQAMIPPRSLYVREQIRRIAHLKG